MSSAWIFFSSALFWKGQNAKDHVHLPVYESVNECMFYSSSCFQTGAAVAPSRRDSGGSVRLLKYSGV